MSTRITATPPTMPQITVESDSSPPWMSSCVSNGGGGGVVPACIVSAVVAVFGTGVVFDGTGVVPC